VSGEDNSTIFSKSLPASARRPGMLERIVPRVSRRYSWEFLRVSGDRIQIRLRFLPGHQKDIQIPA